jgi:hypothetical protein
LRNILDSLILIPRMKNYLKVLAAILMLAAVFLSLSGCRSSAKNSGAPEKAAIIDQLYILEPNSSFIEKAAGILESGGFTVDLWQGKDITVDFYRKLPAMGYKLIIFRVHSGLLMDVKGGEAKALETTYLFTAENYTTVKYVADQLTDKVSNAMMSDKIPLVFAVNSAFIKSSSGKFDNTVVILLGCESYYYNDMPAAFMGKGASAYVGWSTVVSLDHVDKAALNLLENLCTVNLTLADGIARTNADLGQDPSFGAYLKYYPPVSGNQTVRELIQGK